MTFYESVASEINGFFGASKGDLVMMLWRKMQCLTGMERGASTLSKTFLFLRLWFRLKNTTFMSPGENIGNRTVRSNDGQF
jgi:hypothetical protein